MISRIRGCFYCQIQTKNKREVKKKNTYKSPALKLHNFHILESSLFLKNHLYIFLYYYFWQKDNAKHLLNGLQCSQK